MASMYGIMSSVGSGILKFIFNKSSIQFGLFTGLTLVITGTMTWLVSSHLMPSASSAQGATSNLPQSIGYIFTIFNVYYGISVMLSSYATRWIIRRLPIVG